MNLLSKIFSGSKASTVEKLRVRLYHFRDLVQKNNAVLQLMADASEKLGGEYVFDSQYLKNLAIQLKSSTRDVVADLNAITSNQYPELVTACNRIGRDMDAILQGRPVAPRGPNIISIDDTDCELSNVVGYKMARLGEIHQRLGCRVPRGFTITAHACQIILGLAGIDEFAEQRLADNSIEPEEIQQKILRTSIPGKLKREIKKAVGKITREKSCSSLSLRSSALGEDGPESFAGQYTTKLGVSPSDVIKAYLQVIASLFSPKALEYRKARGLPLAAGMMAVGCLCMVRAKTSGVIYTLDPTSPNAKTMIISQAHGLGRTVVDGRETVNSYELSRQHPFKIISKSPGSQQSMFQVSHDGSVQQVPVPGHLQDKPILSNLQLEELATTALRIEKYMKCAQDIEWAIDEDDLLYILQTRPLLIDRTSADHHDVSIVTGKYNILLKSSGEIACRGIGCGRVKIVDSNDNTEDLDPDTVIVTRTSTPRLAALLAKASAVITDVGTATGHLAAVAREFRVPTIVDTGNATKILKDGQEVTVDAEECIVYEGRVEELMHYQLLRTSAYEDSAEFRTLRQMLSRITPLNLKNPRDSNFSPANCNTYHDIIRFAHEKAVSRLTDGSLVRPTKGNVLVRRLTLPIPLDLLLLDLGDGFSSNQNDKEVTIKDINSRPLIPLLEELTSEGVWETSPADMDLDGFMSSATRSMSLAGHMTRSPEQNLALISNNYLHLSLKLGYHFSIVDSYFTDTRNDNYIYFRFAGGATELTRRSRRALLLKKILEGFDFMVEAKGGLVIARRKKLPVDQMEICLRILGRLTGFTRQLDIYLRNDELIDKCVDAFMSGETNPFGC